MCGDSDLKKKIALTFRITSCPDCGSEALDPGLFQHHLLYALHHPGRPLQWGANRQGDIQIELTLVYLWD